MHGQVKSKKLCRPTFCERNILFNCVEHKPGAWWLVMQRLFLLLEIRDLKKLKSTLEIIMEKRMLDTCQTKLLCVHCKNL